MSPDDYSGLHRRYALILEDTACQCDKPEGKEKEKEEAVAALSGAFDKVMKVLHEQKGATLDISIIETEEAQGFIEAHAGVLDSSFEDVEMSDGMRRALQRSDYIFSGIKTFHELNEAFPSLTDENGERKPFERFLNDVRSIDKTYNRNYLQSEYNFAHSSARIAARWEALSDDKGAYMLQYRTAGDALVRPEHARLNGITLPADDRFWDSYTPPNDWNCRCTVVQVRREKYTETPGEQAMQLGEAALAGKKDMFRFNPGKERKNYPAYNPYTIKRCRDCDTEKNVRLGKERAAEGDLCAACQLVRKCQKQREKRDKKQ